MKHLKSVILILISLLSINIISQEESKKFTFTPFGQYGISHRTIKGNYPFKEGPSITYGYGLRVSYNIKKISVTSGIEYQQFGEQESFKGLSFGDQIDPVTGFISNPIDNLTFKYKYNYLAIPLIVEYNRKKLSLFAGLKANIFNNASSKVITKYIDENSSSSKGDYVFDKSELCLSSTYGVLFNIRFGSKMHLKIGPTFDIFHQSISNSILVERMPYKGSLFVGLSF